MSQTESSFMSNITPVNVWRNLLDEKGIHLHDHFHFNDLKFYDELRKHFIYSPTMKGGGSYETLYAVPAISRQFKQTLDLTDILYKQF